MVIIRRYNFNVNNFVVVDLNKKFWECNFFFFDKNVNLKLYIKDKL